MHLRWLLNSCGFFINLDLTCWQVVFSRFFYFSDWERYVPTFLPSSSKSKQVYDWVTCQCHVHGIKILPKGIKHTCCELAFWIIIWTHFFVFSIGRQWNSFHVYWLDSERKGIFFYILAVFNQIDLYLWIVRTIKYFRNIKEYWKRNL